jgi:anti-sigma B factor antagonist
MDLAEQLRIDSGDEQGRFVIRLGGELDMASAPLLKAALEQAEGDTSRPLLLDLQQLRFMDSTGLRIILWARSRWQSHGQELALTAGSSQVQRLLAVSGVGEHLHVIAGPGELPV